MKVGDLVMLSSYAKKKKNWAAKHLANSVGIVIRADEEGDWFEVRWNHPKFRHPQIEVRKDLKIASTKESKGGRKPNPLKVGDFVEMSVVGKNNPKNEYLAKSDFTDLVVGKVIGVSVTGIVSVDWSTHAPDERIKAGYRTGYGMWFSYKEMHDRSSLKRASPEKAELWDKPDDRDEE